MAVLHAYFTVFLEFIERFKRYFNRVLENFSLDRDLFGDGNFQIVDQFIFDVWIDMGKS